MVGIGDMSGDVLATACCCSPDPAAGRLRPPPHPSTPDPDCARSWAERERLFRLPRSSWDDYDRSVLSEGGIYPRSAKSILSPAAQARAALAIEAEELTPLSCCARSCARRSTCSTTAASAPTSRRTESHAEAGDKAGDAYRVDGADLRCKVLVEGGNLGCTQQGASSSPAPAGASTPTPSTTRPAWTAPDHEVNIKILLGPVVEAGDMTPASATSCWPP